MPVDPHIAAVLTMLDEAEVPPMYEGSPEAGRALYLQLTHGARTPEQLTPVAGTEDCTVPGHPEIYVVGDLNRLKHGDGFVPAVAPAAMQEGGSPPGTS